MQTSTPWPKSRAMSESRRPVSCSGSRNNAIASGANQNENSRLAKGRIVGIGEMSLETPMACAIIQSRYAATARFQKARAIPSERRLASASAAISTPPRIS